MPCYSVITNTQMTDVDRLVQALEAIGHKVTSKSANHVSTAQGMEYFRSSQSQGFATRSTDEATMAKIGKKYGQIAARAWAKKQGFSVLESDEDEMVLVKR